MTKIDTIIAVAGWEDRFVLGVERSIIENSPAKVVSVTFGRYRSMTEGSRARVRQFAEGHGAQYEEVPVERDPVLLWRGLQQWFDGGAWAGKSVLVDISTMPREVIWWLFSMLLKAGALTEYVYYQPAKYADAWVTRDTEQPRLVYQHSGISKLGSPTCLLLITGFDSERVAQLVQFFEPLELLIGIQSGQQFDNFQKNALPSRTLFERDPSVQLFEVDAYGPDHGLASIEAAISSVITRCNVLAASLGPKLSAVSLFNLHQKHPELGLAYAASRQLSPLYSEGIGNSFGGSLAAWQA